ncbi:XVIPCD domain-containing protein [Lysobacter enzymogenes]|uniref:XVIPCD domain-containing protein n=1 Tax=Lysobacter enzymogenes TaxID=69 RepID=UPI00384CAF7E
MNSQSQDQTLRVGTQADSQTLDEVRRGQQRNLLSSPSHAQHEQFAHVRVCLDRNDAARQFSAGERDNLAGALLLEATRERQRVDGVAFSQDGKRAFAVEGDNDSPARRLCHVQTEQAAQQSLQRSSEQLAQLVREQDVREQQRQTERERENQRERQNPERGDAHNPPSAAARALTRERD